MQGLTRLLKRKIAITALFWCLPLIALPRSWFAALGVPINESLLFARLLGVAYLALLVGYIEGLRGVEKGENPIPVIHMGVVSNAFAGAVLAYFGFNGAWSAWGLGATVFMWVSTVGAFYVAAKLLKFRYHYASAGTS